MPRPRTAGGIGLVILFAIAGCLPRQPATRTAEFLDRVRGWAGIGSGQGLYLQTALIDVPAPDSYLDRDLWSAASVANPLSPEQSALLELNGLRVRVVSGVAPPKFLELVASERSVLDPMLRSAPPGTAKVVPVNGPIAETQYRVRTDLKADDEELTLHDAECGLSVTVKPAANGKLTLTCEPRIQHGEHQAWLKPSADGTAFTRSETKPLTAYPSFGWEVTVGQHDYLLFGSTEDPAGTVGGTFFRAKSGTQIRQRVLVIRAGKHADAPPAAVPARTSAAASAQWPPTARGTAP